MSDEEYETWDPVTENKSISKETLVADQRRRLFHVRDMLQRAMINGGQFDVFERTNAMDPTIETAPYTPASAARHKVITEDSRFAKMSASERLLSSDLRVSAELEGNTSSENRPSGLGGNDVTSLSTQSEIVPTGANNGNGQRGVFDKPISFASNTATSILLSRQFEALSRKDIMLEQSNEFNLIMHTFFQATRWRIQGDFNAEARVLAEEVEAIRQEERDNRSRFTQNLIELENGCRRRVEALQAECSSRLDMEIGRALDVLRGGHTESRRNWIEQQEEHSRNTIILEADRYHSRLMGVQLSEAQGLVVQNLMRDRVPHNATGLALGKETPTAEQIAASQQRGKSPTSTQKNNASGAAAANVNPNDPFGTPPAGPISALIHEDADKSSVAGTDYSDESERRNMEMMARFTPYWGWMCKSSGVLMTWQRRFFVFTQRGKLRYSTSSEKGPWTTLLSAPNILRVEVDSYHDSSHGVRPPSDQYHQYGFYVDSCDPKTQRQQRVRFCCFSRQELNNWLTVLRDASDIVFNLEQMGAIARSPFRRRLDPTVVEKLMHTQIGTGRGQVSLNTYRKRAQFEDDLAALESQQIEKDKEEREEKQKSPRREASPRGQSPPPGVFK